MPNSEHKRLMELLEAALDLAPTERGEFLDAAGGKDTPLRRRLNALIAAHETAGAFLPEQPRTAEPTPGRAGEKGVGPAGTPKSNPNVPRPRTEGPGSIIGRYRLLQKIGEGGCGTVYMAEQDQPMHRRVALKLIKPGMDTQAVIARFEAERQALAMMDHPNIAKVFDAGSTDSGRPYFVMELIRGKSITVHCDENRLDTGARLELFILVCKAIQHAHQKGIIHRDIKPNNILVTYEDGVPVPKVIDFGIAKATQGRLINRTLFTAFEQFVGTPAYMSPEQAEFSTADIDTRSDIYSLGVLLYELLTGRTPFEVGELAKVGIEAICKTIREVDPPKPSLRLSTLDGDALTTTAAARGTVGERLQSQIRGDLDCIVIKCLDKSRTRRYATATSLADDLQRHLSSEPVLARPPSLGYRLSRSVARHRGLFLSSAAVAVALILGTVASLHEAMRARHESQTKAEVIEFLRTLINGAAPEIARGEKNPVLNKVLEEAEQRVMPLLVIQPESTVELGATIGQVEAKLGRYQVAESIDRRVLNALRGLDRSAAPEAAGALFELGHTLEQLGRISEATHELAASLRLARHFSMPLLEAEVLNEMAYIAMEQDHNYSGAENLATNAIARLNESPGSTESQRLKIEERLTEVYFRRGQCSNALQVALTVLERQERLLPRNHPDTLHTRYMIGASLMNLGRFDEAEKQLMDLLALQRTILPASHPDIPTTEGTLGLVYSYQGRFKDAETIGNQAYSAHSRAIGADAADSLFMEMNVAESLRNQNRFDDARLMFEHEIAAFETQKNTAGALEVKYGLAILYHFSKDLTKAEALTAEVLAACRTPSGPRVLLVDVLRERTSILLEQGRFDDALALAREASGLPELGQSWQKFVVEGQLGLALAGLRRFAEAEVQLVDAFQNLAKLDSTVPAIEKVRIAEILDGCIQVRKLNGKKPEPGWEGDSMARRARAELHYRYDP